jgi:hypothetical protein
MSSRRDPASSCRGNFVNPLYDFTWVAGGFVWVLEADRLEEESRPKTYGLALAEPINPPPDPPKSYAWMRGIGYGQAAFFGLSTLWGLYVEARCARARPRPSGEAVAQQKNDLQRGAFPSLVEGFTLGMRVAEAERACRAKRDDYQPAAAGATCAPPMQAATGTSAARLQYRLGALSEVTMVYTPPAAQVGALHEQMYAGLVSKYGPPQRDRAAVPNECRVELAACLERGTLLTGATWYWPNGSVTLVPVWLNGHAEVDLRFALEDAAE